VIGSNLFRKHTVHRRSFFRKADWLSFGVTACVALSVYLLTLAPEVGFGYAGINATAAMYPSASVPSGHPLWAIWGWVFIKSLPFSNIAWRVNLGSAVAGALASGCLALTVSRVGVLFMRIPGGPKAFRLRERTLCRVVCGIVAGLGLAFDGAFWRKAVIADTWPLSLFLFAATFCFATAWVFRPRQRMYRFAASLLSGLCLSESQALIPALVATAVWALIVVRKDWVRLNRFSIAKAATACGVFLSIGVLTFVAVAIFSMTNPPVNWGYARTEEGFFHILTRGQFDRIQPTETLGRLFFQWITYAKNAVSDMGVAYLIAAIAPLFVLRKLSASARGWFLGVLLLWLACTTAILIGLNLDRATVDAVKTFFSLSHFILLQMAGFGLMTLAASRLNPAGRWRLRPE
jgi:hypothetical protein